MTIRSPRLLALIAEQTPPADVAAFADTLVAAIPQDVLADTGRTTTWLGERGISTHGDDLAIAPRLEQLGVTTARWVRFLAIRRTEWFAGIGRQARNRASVDLLGPFAFNAYTDLQVGRLLKAA